MFIDVLVQSSTLSCQSDWSTMNTVDAVLLGAKRLLLALRGTWVCMISNVCILLVSSTLFSRIGSLPVVPRKAALEVSE